MFAARVSPQKWVATGLGSIWWYYIEQVTGGSPCGFRSGLTVCHIFQIICWPVTKGPKMEAAVALRFLSQEFLVLNLSYLLLFSWILLFWIIFVP